MMMRRTTLLVVCVLLSGCGFFSRAKSQFYSLETIETTATHGTMGGVPIGIDAIELPPGLDRREIVARGADHRLEVRGTHQWASPLEEMVIHTLAFDLANRLPEGMVVLPGQPKPAAMRSLSVVFEDLASGPDDVFILDARWTIGELTKHERITVPLQSKESASIVAAMSQALATLADRVAGGV
jgi:uncharacterized lipoprotein YmbA